ncbi:MAG: hypothetical protein J7M11_01905, partial [Elusimicrobia bacterium]|nr:hypothetical protein [Elusimicrobiota bacterium]
GRNKKGTVASLKKWAEELGVEVLVVRTKIRGGSKISTTAIKKQIALSQTFRAAELMGRPYSICGKKVKGKGIAGTLGFPTVNLIPEKHKAVPEGVFAAEVTCKAGRFPAVVNAGPSPTFGIKKVFEFHAIGAESAALVAKCGKFTVEFGRFIRKQKKFASRASLIERIKKDIEIAKKRSIC